MSVCHTTSYITSGMGERMEAILQVNDSPGQLAMHTTCNMVMIDVVKMFMKLSPDSPCASS